MLESAELWVHRMHLCFLNNRYKPYNANSPTTFITLQSCSFANFCFASIFLLQYPKKAKHIVGIPMYKEPLELIAQTLDSLAVQPNARQKITVFVGLEEGTPDRQAARIRWTVHRRSGNEKFIPCDKQLAALWGRNLDYHYNKSQEANLDSLLPHWGGLWASIIKK